MKYYSRTADAVLSELKATRDGLTEKEALLRLQKHGENRLPETKKKTRYELFLEQFKSYLIIILMAAAAVDVFLGEYTEGAAIFIVLLINAVFGYTQEHKAQTSIEALKSMTAPKSMVLRDGVRAKIESANLVAGDIIFVEAGDKVPADARLIEAANLEVEESSLTGESVPSEKTTDVIPLGMQIADQKNMLFSGTIVVNGRGIAVVTATGKDTEIGKIAGLVQSGTETTPLEKKLKQLSAHISYIVAFAIFVVFITGIVRGEEIVNLFMTTVSLAVAAIPEGLPIVVTLTSAVGIQRMAKKNALIRRLPSVETLGCTTVICTDKTGTLTTNQMTVRKMYADGEMISVSGEGYSTEGGFPEDAKSMAFKILLKAGVLCNDASIHEKPVGDPTEIALLVSGAKAGLNKETLEKESPRTGEKTFNSDRKYMITVHGKTAYAKGAPDALMKICDHVLIGGKEVRLDKKETDAILSANECLAGEALRVLGFAYKRNIGDSLENGFVFLGLQGMIDPPRKDVRENILKCRDAGIRVIMITGDHPATASAIARELGLEVKILTGVEIDALDDLNSVVEDVIIYARVSPEHKLRIVEALKKRGHVVAMTGDGVNDAPALKKADIGIAMGITGTDVAKESSDMILADDNFASIVSAIEEGRRIYENIKKFLRFQLSTNAGAILTVFIGTLLSLPLPLTALQLLWINIIVDGPPALSLGMEPAGKEYMARPPRNPREKILTKSVLSYVIATGSMMAFCTLAIFSYMLEANPIAAGTMAFTTFVFFQIFNVLNCRSECRSVFSIGLLSNKISIIAIVCTILAQSMIVSIPFFQRVFGTVSLSSGEWMLSMATAFSIFVAFEIYKAAMNSRKPAVC